MILWSSLFLGLFLQTSLPPSGRILRGTIRVYERPVMTADEAGMIRGNGRYAIWARGERCKEGFWWRISPGFWVCSGWFIPGSEAAGGLEDWENMVLPSQYYQGTGTHSFLADTVQQMLNGRYRRLRMLRGFLPEEQLLVADRPVFRLLDGGFISTSSVRPFPRTSLSSIAAGRTDLPLAFVTSQNAHLYKRAGEDLEKAMDIPRYSVRKLGSEEQDIYWLKKEQLALRKADIRIAFPPPDPPTAVKDDDEHWVDVDLDNNILFAFKGPNLVRVFLVSGSRETPSGIFRVYWKIVHQTFDRQRARNAYYLQSVPYILYFRDAYALHGAYWHDEFGTNETHGCINLSPDDARWLFTFLAPPLPPGYISIRPTSQTKGGLIRLRRK